VSEDRATGKVVAVLNDLIFETKIRSTAQALGIETTVVRSLAAFDAELDRIRPSLLIIDLNTAGVDAVAAGNTHTPRPYVVAFVSHVDQDLAKQATEAGADQVMPRSRFTAELPRILQTHCTPA
jgi:DNA-binding NarL/FixJ family response regulator